MRRLTRPLRRRDFSKDRAAVSPRRDSRGLRRPRARANQVYPAGSGEFVAWPRRRPDGCRPYRRPVRIARTAGRATGPVLILSGYTSVHFTHLRARGAIRAAIEAAAWLNTG